MQGNDQLETARKMGYDSAAQPTFRRYADRRATKAAALLCERIDRERGMGQSQDTQARHTVDGLSYRGSRLPSASALVRTHLLHSTLRAQHHVPVRIEMMTRPADVPCAILTEQRTL